MKSFLVLSSLQCRHGKSTLIKNLFSLTGLQYQTAVSCYCLFACAQGFIKPISKRKCKILDFIECRHESVPVQKAKKKQQVASCVMEQQGQWNVAGDVMQVLHRQGKAKRGMGSLIILRCESHTTHLENIVSIDYLILEKILKLVLVSHSKPNFHPILM